MKSQMEEKLDAGACAEAALDTVCQSFIEMFSGTGDELMMQRACRLSNQLATRRHISQWSKEDADTVTAKVMELDSEHEIRTFLKERLVQ